MKKAGFVVLLCALCASLSAWDTKAEDAVKEKIFVEKVPGLSEDFIRGVDISSLGDIEKAGGKYFNAEGKEEDLFKILKDNGVNWVRLRVWHNPVIAGKPYGGGNNSVENDLPLAKRAKDAGLKLLVDFHYSDTWADPGKQHTPKAWRKMDAKELNAAVEDYTRESLLTFEKAGARADMVQIGNELNNGFCWPLGKIWGNDGETVGGFKGFTNLLKSAAKGVRSAQGKGEKMKIVIHLADGGDNSLYRTVFDEIKKAKVDYDVIGLSFYCYWHGTYDDLKRNMSDVAKRYGKETMVMEAAYGFTPDDGDDQGNVFKTFSEDTTGYRPSVQGQATCIRDCIAAVNEAGGTGVFYWEPAWIPVAGAGLSSKEGDTWENQAMFDFSGKVLPSMAVWNLVYGKGQVKNVWGGEAVSGGNSVPYAMADKVETITKPTQTPKLPETVKVVFTDDSEGLVKVTWDSYDWKNQTKTGVVVLKGKITESDFCPEIYVEVSNKVNLMTDSSWESGKLGEWKLNGSSTACFVENNKGNAHTGKWTYKYWLGQGFKSSLTREFKGIENGNYICSIWAMGGGGENQIRLLASDFGQDKKQISAKIENSGWLNWKKYQIEIPVTNNSVKITIYLDTNGGNWGNFDDVELYKVEE
ncbi:MAG: glycosyl hydrolase 53 family protein [Treponema sp.]|nr:glycosyl hydrolase 53 family protein [Treponema sp.]